MSDELLHLWRLRELDERVAAERGALAKFPELKRGLEGRVVAERERLAAHVRAAEEALKARRKLEQEIEGVTAQQRQFESRQPSVKTNEEFRALTLEIDGCRRKRSDLETLVLMRFEEEEALSKQRPVIDQALKAAEAERASRIAEIERDEAAGLERVAALDAERGIEMGALPPATRSRYERILGSHQGRAVVPVLKNACGGCYRAQPPQMLQEFRRRDRVLLCEGCGRMVIWPPDEA